MVDFPIVGPGRDNWGALRFDKKIPVCIENIGDALEAPEDNPIADVTSVKTNPDKSYRLSIVKKDPYITSAKFEEFVKGQLEFQSKKKDAPFAYSIISTNQGLDVVINPSEK